MAGLIVGFCRDLEVSKAVMSRESGETRLNATRKWLNGWETTNTKGAGGRCSEYYDQPNSKPSSANTHAIGLFH